MPLNATNPTRTRRQGLRRLSRKIALSLGAALALVAASLACTPAAAMTFAMTTTGQCAHRTCLQASGEITGQSGKEFHAFVKAHRVQRGGLVILDSTGGDLVQGLAIGAEIRAAGLSTSVEGAGIDAAGQTRSANCSSACTYVFLGGVDRAIGPGCKVGVHQMRSVEGTEGLDAENSQLLLSSVATYIRSMGVTLDVFTLALTTPPERMYWFSVSEMSSFAVTTPASLA